MNHNLSFPADTLHNRGRSSVANLGIRIYSSIAVIRLVQFPFSSGARHRRSFDCCSSDLVCIDPDRNHCYGRRFLVISPLRNRACRYSCRLLLLLWIGLLNGGVVYGWDMTDIIRDLIPCVYLFVPLLLLPAMKRSTLNWLAILPWIISVMGVILSIRFYVVVQISLWKWAECITLIIFCIFRMIPAFRLPAYFFPLWRFIRGKAPARFVGWGAL